MVFAHIVDDYSLQGWLANAKQRQWWKENAPDKLYKHDYIMALIMHSLSWSFMIMLPVAIYIKLQCQALFFIAFILNTIVHIVVDHLKANVHCINLIQDQCLHLLQILATALIFFS